MRVLPLTGARQIALVGAMALLLLLPGHDRPALAQSCSRQATGLIPLTDLGEGRYEGEVGGLYSGGSNTPPDGHLALGLDLASQIQPLDQSGHPDPGGIIGLVSIGVSNTRDEFGAFSELVGSDPEVNPALAVINGAQGARDLNTWSNSSRSNPWRNLGVILQQEGISPSQVQVAWVMLPDRTQGTVDLDDIPDEVEKLTAVMHHLNANFPNLRLAYLSSRIYGGYASDGEPRAYHHGFTTRSFIEQQISAEPSLNPDPAAGPVLSPWVAWGPYTWADGTTPRSDGLTWECEDFERDGVHPAPSGAAKVAALLMEHFRTDPTAASWFLGSESGPSTTAPPPTSTTRPPLPGTMSIPPPTTTSAPPATLGTIPPDSDDDEVDVPWLIGGVALGLVVSLGVSAAVFRRRRNHSSLDGSS